MKTLTREFRQLLRLYGVAVSYRDAWGETKQVDTKVLTTVLTALGVKCGTSDARKQSLVEVRKILAQRVLNPVIVWDSRQDLHKTILSLPARFSNASAASVTLRCTLSRVDGAAEVEELSADVVASWDFDPAVIVPLRERILGRERLLRYPLSYHGMLAEGYYQLEVVRAHDSAFIGRARVVVAPQYCYLPSPDLRRWGIASQLYSLRSQPQQLIGDFLSLAQLAVGISKLGGAFVGLNPLHCLPLTDNQTWSPYVPLSRELLNILYISIEQVPEWPLVSAGDQADYLAASLEKIGSDDFAVNYALASKKKVAILATMSEIFHQGEVERGTERGRNFKNFQKSIKSLLASYSKCADAKSMGVEAFAYAQWVAHLQLTQAVEAVEPKPQRSRESQPAWMGMYLDLALGGTVSSLEVRLQPDIYADSLSMGAPPDELNLKGQSWGLVPYIPWKLREAGYSPYVRVLRAAMRYAGAVRIDHAMSLSRVFCVPVAAKSPEGVNTGGAYVYSRARELMAVVALESQRHRCVVIGEDLGTVPERFRQLMREFQMLSYKVLWFMQDADGFVDPRHYDHLSLVVPTTHDLPTVAGFLVGDDNELRRTLKLFPLQEMYDQYCERRWTELDSLLKLLAERQLCPADVGNLEQLVQRLLMLLATSGSSLYAIPVEDLLVLRQQVNVPGTTHEYPNWKSQLPLLVDEFLAHPNTKLLAATCGLARRGQSH